MSKKNFKKTPTKSIDDKTKTIIDTINRKPRKWFYIIPVLIPVLFLCLLEISLRLFDYGKSYEQWIDVTDNKIILNPDLAYRYFFTTEGIPYSNQNVFDKVKKENTFRIFILGESSAAGYPFMPNGSFGVYLKKRLELLYPGTNIEIINLGMTAINSYALMDMLPGIIEKEPDLVLIYTGHNEYYGALGVGSMESFGSSRSVIKLVLWLNKFKTVELLRNIIKAVPKIFSSSDKVDEGGTLMARMAKEQTIPYRSSLFNNGIEQFKDNLTEILETLKEAKIPVIIGTLTYNLKDQPPFISIKENSKSAADIYNEAMTELMKKNYSNANKLFRQAKDLDALRFRAPEKINETIKQLAKQFNYPIADIDNFFDSVSPNGIVGNNLMTDHLHPTLNGYQKIGKVFFEKINETNVLPRSSISKFTFNQQDSIAIKSYHFTQLDSTIAKFRIQYLKNDWPFVDKEKSVRVNDLIRLSNFIDTIAIKVVDNKIPWEKAHRDAADIYFNRKEYAKFAEEYRTLIDQYPVINEYYENPINQLLYAKQYDVALDLLKIYHKVKPTSFNSKWLGIILLSKNDVDAAISYLEESFLSNSTDAQVLYNIAGAYSIKKNYNKALEYINRCIASEPDFPGARQLQYQLNSAAKR
ncbi:MAG: hypothetical protein C4539_03210 [Ignavibacteriales bacterium]|nr:MAG: hypothetical protein C4539_03210 [Ignavibacteriales bacterium]